MIASGCIGSTINLWNAETGDCLQTLHLKDAENCPVNRIQLDDDVLASITMGAASLRVWNMRNGESCTLSDEEDFPTAEIVLCGRDLGLKPMRTYVCVY